MTDSARNNCPPLSSRSSKKQEVQITFGDLSKAAELQQLDTQSITESLERLHVAGNVVRSALAISTEGHNPIKTTLQLPKILMNQPCEKWTKAPRKISYETKCPISKALRKATEKQSERERYWRRRRGDFLQKFNAKQQKNRKQSLPKLECNALFLHMKQNYADFEAQENAKKGRRKVFSRIINRKGRVSMIN